MKPLLAAALLMLLASPALATPPAERNEVFVSIGDAGWIFLVEDLVGVIATLGAVTYGDQEGGLQYAAGYQRRFGNWASAGVTMSWAGSRKKMYVLHSYHGDVERHMFTAMLEARAHWLQRRSVDLYSGLAIGGVSLGSHRDTFADEDDYSGVGFHLLPIGMRVGRKWGGFVETGIGYHGFLKAGLSARL